MPNLLDSSGLVTKTFNEVVTDLQTAYRSIYGADINLDSSTEDGQLINIFAQIIVDNLDLQAQVYTSFDPDQAIGRTLDMRLGFNGVKRKGGTYTLTEIVVTTDRAVNLAGLDSAVNDPDGVGFTVSDNSGNQFILANSYSIPGPGTTSLIFRAKNLGAILTSLNTINVPVTVVLGVTAINNPNPALTTGLPEETDEAVKVRRRKSVAISSQGYLDGLVAALLDIDGVTSAAVYENDTGTADADGIPGHSIWAIVEGGADADIAQAIYAKRSACSGMKGSTVYTITRPNGSPFNIYFDRTGVTRLYAKAKLDALSGDIATTGNTTSGSAIITAIPSTASFTVGMLVRGAGIPAGATVLSVDSASQIHITANATATATAAALTVVPLSVAAVRAAIVAALQPGIYETVDVNELAALIRAAFPNALVTFPSNYGFSSDGVTYYYQLTPAAKNLQFTLGTVDVALL